MSGAFLITKYVQVAEYESSTTLYVFKNIDKTRHITYNELMIGRELVKDYRELVKSRSVSKAVIDKLGLKNISVEQLSGKLSVHNKNDTRIIEITTRDQNPELAMDIVNQVAAVFQSKAVDIMKVDNVQIIDRAQKPLSPVSPRMTLNLAIAFFIGLALGAAIVFAIELFDNTIKDPEDIEYYYKLPVLGNIPYITK
jgi:capsular polysaccharide biosynthesis protein